MLAKVTNRSRGARGFETRDRGTVLLEPGGSAILDLVDHPAHRAWETAGEVTMLAREDRAEGAAHDRAPAPRRPARGRASPN